MIRRVALAAALAAGFVGPAAAHAAGDHLTADREARAYYAALERNTPWLESTWDDAAGHYAAADFDFAGVLGNAVLLRYGDYDASLTGISRTALADHTLRTIEHFAASNRWVDPNGEWGAKIYFDSTFETYFVDAARLLWPRLDATTRANVETIVRDEANYVAGLGAADDPRSGGWTTNGLGGSFRGDTKLEEMGARTMPLATALAFLPDDPAAPQWREWLDRWLANMDALPAAGNANATVIDGRTVADWTTAHNVYDSFIVENHGSYAPNYQEASGDYAGRDAAQFAIAGLPAPPVISAVPDDAELWRTLEQTGTDAGVPEDFMVADRHHLYGKNVLSLAYEDVVRGDRDLARAEAMLIEHLAPYQAYPPSGRLTKFSGEAKYEPEARANLAQAYLLHLDRGRWAGDVAPVSARRYFADNSRAEDYGADVGLVAQQTPESLAAAVTKPGYVKFAWVPGHDDWFFDVSGDAPAMLPSSDTTVTSRSVTVDRTARDGFEATATVLGTRTGSGQGYAGFATLPDGSAVYATTGTAANEGALRLYSLAMPGVRGLDGDRTFTGETGSFTVAPGDHGAGDDGLGDGNVDDVTFAPTSVRYVRMYGEQPGTRYGYSIYSLEVRDGAGGADLAQGHPTTASTSYPGYPPERATDGNPATRWAVSVAGRSDPHSTITVDLGSVQEVDRAHILWEEQAAYGAAYDVQGSTDGVHWTTLAAVTPTAPGRVVAGNWVDVDDRAGFVVRGSENPIRAGATTLTLSAGPPSGSAGMVVEAYPHGAAAVAKAAGAPAPEGGPPALASSLAGGFLTLLNLGAEPIEGASLWLPTQDGTTLFRGVQRIDADGSTYDVTMPAASGRVEAPRFRLASREGAPVPLRADVTDSRTVRLTNLGDQVARVRVVSAATGRARATAIPPGMTHTVRFRSGPLTPTANLATSMPAYPASPLPPGETEPGLALDGDRATAWRPGAAGRIVVDLGAPKAIAAARGIWSPGRVPPFDVQVSDDGLAWTTVASSPGGGPARAELPVGRTARYVALQVHGWREHDARLAELYLGASTAG